jgi:hypothetical protein
MNKTLALGLLIGGLLAGCEVKPSVVPTFDTALDRTSAQYAADAVKHFPFKADLPKGQTHPARALVDYSLDFLDFTNLSKQNLTNLEIWINRQYVMSLPLLKSGDIKRLNFRMFYDDQGDHFPLNNNLEKGGVIVRQLEMIEDGKIYEVPVRQGL